MCHEPMIKVQHYVPTLPVSQYFVFVNNID